MSPVSVEGPAAGQFEVTPFAVEDGLPQASVSGLAQDSDGYLYLATFGGLARFDGRQFSTLGPDEGVRPTRITAVAADPETNDVWLGSQYGEVYRIPMAGGPAERVDVPLPQRSTVWGFELTGARDLVLSSRGAWEGLDGAWTLVFHHSSRVALRRDLGDWFAGHDGLFEGETPLLGGPVHDLAVDPQGVTWVARNSGVARVGDAADVLSTPTEAWRVLCDRAGRLWASSGRDLYLLGPAADVQTTTVPPTVFRLGAPVRALFEDRSGSVWVGTDGAGVARLRPHPFERHGRGGVPFVDVSEDPVLWGGGCDVFGPEGRVETGLAGCESSVLRSGGHLYAGDLDGNLSRDGLLLARVADGVVALAPDQASPDAVWVGTAGAGAYRWVGGTVTAVEGLGQDIVDVIATDPSGTTWFGLSSGVAALDPSGQLRVFGEAVGLGSQVRAMWFDPAGGTWLGTYGGGLSHLSADGEVTRLGLEQGLRELVVSSLVPDATGHLWANGNRGISRFTIAELRDVVAGARPALSVLLVATGEGNGGATPTGGLRADGTLWFPTIDGAVSFDPSRVGGRSPPPLPLIESVVVAGANRVRRPARVTAPDGALALTFAAPAPDGSPVAYRYRVSPGDRAWRDLGASSALALGDLAPGEHHLELAVQGPSGAWSDTTAHLWIDVPWRWSDSLVVRVGLPAALMAGFTTFLVWRLRVNRERSRALETEIRERARLAEGLARSEAHYRSVFEAATDPLLVVGVDGVVTDANPAAESLYGGTASVRGVATTGLFRGEQFVTGDGTAVPVRLQRARLGDVELYTIVDLSAVSELQRHLVEAERLDAIGRVAGSVAHDFNNLLAVIRTGVSELRDHPDHHEPLRHVEEAVDHGADLIRQLLAVGGQQLLRPEPVNVASLARRIEGRARRLGPRGVSLRTTVERDCVVDADAAQLERVLLTLALTALQRAGARPDGPGAVTLQVARWQATWVESRGIDPHTHMELPFMGTVGVQSRGHDWVVLTLADDGPSLPPAVTARLFEPFVGDTDRPGGALGLSAVRGFLAQSGGHVLVRSGLGATSFELLLPAVDRVAPTDTPVPAPSVQRRYDLVVVDDEHLVRRALTRMLQNAGHQVRSAETGADALELLAAREPDLLVTDVLMPRMSGPELVAIVRARHPKVAVVYVTAYAQEHAGSLEAPVITKPFERSDLEAAFHRAMAARAP
jgi:two-component system cell cycle sensor histidine kinase/response regulator CckA